MNMKLFMYLITGLSLGLASLAGADTLTGRIVGHHCAHEGTTCPIDKLDPHIVLERDFVLVDGDSYYFMPNLPRDVKIRHVLDRVTIEGSVDSKFNVLTVDALMVDGRSKPVWSAKMQAEVQQTFRYYDGTSGRR